MKKIGYILLVCFFSLSNFLFGQTSVNGGGSMDTFAKAETYFGATQYTKAEPLFKTFLKIHPNDLKTIEYLGDIAGFAKDWDTAIEYYERLVELQPKVANYHYKYGGVLGMKALEINKLRALGLIGDIKKAFITAAELDPLHLEARWALVEFYIQLPSIVGGSEDKALLYAGELFKLSPVDGYLAKGYIAEYNDRSADAEEHYKNAVSVGGSVTCYTKLSEHYEKNENPDAAIATLMEAQGKHKQNNRLHYQLGKVAGQYGIGLDQGIQCLHRYIEFYSTKDGVPKDWAYLRLAQIYRHKTDKEEAKKWIEKALASRSDFKEALAERSLINAL
ncbi:MAG: tetratricopeptide repeat protein [Dokdonia sp.]|nr:tetratricopeptide repeat protein [Dokdonia sp.]